MAQPIPESRETGRLCVHPISEKQIIITTVVAVAALAVLVIGLMAILPQSADLIPLGFHGGIACIIAGSVTVIALVALNCMLLRTPDKTPAPLQVEDLKGTAPAEGRAPITKRDPVEVRCLYCLHNEKRRFNLPSESSCLIPEEQKKIDKLVSHFRENGADFVQELQADISRILFVVTKFPDTGRIELGVYLKFVCNTQEVDEFSYDLPTFEMSGGAIPETLPQDVENAMRQSKILWDPIYNLLTTQSISSKLFDRCKIQAEHYKLEVKNLRLADRFGFRYSANSERLTLNKFDCHYKGEWLDGQPHYQNGRLWDDKRDQWLMFLHLKVNEINLDTVEHLLERLLDAASKNFDYNFKRLVEDTEKPPRPISWDEWFASLKEVPPSELITMIEEAVNSLQQEVTPDCPFPNLEFTEANVEAIKEAIQKSFKKPVMMLHPDKVGEQGEEKFKRVMGLYREIEECYKLLGLTW